MNGIDIYMEMGEIEEKYIEEALSAQPIKKKRIIWVRHMAAVAAVFVAAFIGMINLFPSVSFAMSGIAVLSDIVKAVTFDKSMKACMDNEYAQYVGASMVTEEGYTAKVICMVVDASRISVFYTSEYDMNVQEGNEIYCFPSAADLEGEPIECVSSPIPTETENLYELRMDFTDAKVPDVFVFHLNYYNMENELISESTCTLYPSEEYRKKVGQYEIQQTIEIDGQKIIVDRLNIYPTQAELQIHTDKNNTKYITNLTAILEDENGNVYQTKENGRTGTFDENGDLISTWYESPYFAKAKELTIKITEAGMLSKEAVKCQISYEDGTISSLPEGMHLAEMNLDEEGTLEIALEFQENLYQTMNPVYAVYAESDMHCDTVEYGASTQNGITRLDIVIPQYKDGKYELQCQNGPVHTLTNPVEIKIENMSNYE